MQTVFLWSAATQMSHFAANTIIPVFGHHSSTFGRPAQLAAMNRVSSLASSVPFFAIIDKFGSSIFAKMENKIK